MNRPSATQVLTLAAMAVLGAAASAAQAPTPPSIVRAAFAGAACGSPAGSSSCEVLIEADGPLPQPSSGTVKNPDRIYLDFAGARGKASGVPPQPGARLGIRIAVHSDAPLVTRVVIDLPAPASYTIDASQRMQGRVLVRLTDVRDGATPTPPVARAPASAGAPAKTALRPHGPYGATIKAVFAALERVRDDLSLLDRKSMPPPDSLRTDALQLSTARDALASAKPPPTLAAAHAQLVSACGLAAMAVESAARNAGADVAPETASAAAGALILIERAHTALSSVQ